MRKNKNLKELNNIGTGIFILNQSIDKLRYGLIQKGIINDITNRQLDIIQDAVDDCRNGEIGEYIEYEDTVKGLLEFDLVKLMRLKALQIKMMNELGDDSFHTLTDIHEKLIELGIEDRSNLDDIDFKLWKDD